MKKVLIVLACLAAILCWSPKSFAAVQYTTYYLNKASSHKGHVEAYVDNNLQQYWIEHGAKRIDDSLVIIPNNDWNKYLYDFELMRLTILHEKIITGAMDKFDRVEAYWTSYYYFQKQLALGKKKEKVTIKHYNKLLQQKLELIAKNREAEKKSKNNDWRRQLNEQQNRNRGGNKSGWYYENGSWYLKRTPFNNPYYYNRYNTFRNNYHRYPGHRYEHRREYYRGYR